MAKLSDLLKFKKEITIYDPLKYETDGKTKVALKKVWIRILGDEDLKDAYQAARIASAEKRKNLRNPEHKEYKDEIAQLSEVPKENLIMVIAAARDTEFISEASIVVVRDDMPTIEQVSTRPDAPSLEDQERLDTLIKEIDEGYQKRIEEFVETKRTELAAELSELPDEQLIEMAKRDLANIQAMESFVTALNEQKGYLGTYEDEACTQKSCDSIEEFTNLHSQIKQQILDEYSNLELNDDEVKN